MIITTLYEQILFLLREVIFAGSFNMRVPIKFVIIVVLYAEECIPQHNISEIGEENNEFLLILNGRDTERILFRTKG